MKRFLSCLGLFHALICLAALPDRIPFDNLGGRTELLSIRSVTQDSTGRIWFGTDKSLYSYDGYSLRSYPSSLGRLQINALTFVEGNILLCCNNGLILFDNETETYTEFPYFRDDMVRAVVIREDCLYVGAESGLYAFYWKSPDSSTSVQRLCTEGVFSMLDDGDRLWLGTMDGLGEYSFSGKRYRSVPVEITANHRVVTTMFLYRPGYLWVGAPLQMIELNTQKEETEKLLSLKVLKSVAHYADDCYLLGTDDGLLAYDPNSGEIRKIAEGSFWSMYTDREGNIWSATDNGLLLTRSSTIMQTLDTGDAPENALFSAFLVDSKGRLWVGGSEGLLLYLPDESAGYRLLHRYTMSGSVWTIPHNRVKTIVESRHDGNIYLATDAGYLVFDERTETFIRHTIEESNNWIYDILVDGNDLWMASFDGLYRMSGDTVKAHYTMQDGLSSDDVAQLAKDRSGRIWILTRDQQIHILNPRDGTLQRYDLESVAQSRFADCIINDLEGRIWIAAQREIIRIGGFQDENPVFVWSLESRASSEVFSMDDFLGWVWVCTSEGFFLINKEDGIARHINTGMHYISAAYDNLQDKVLFGAPGEIACFPGSELDRMTGNQSLPVTITSVMVNDQLELSQADVRSGSLDLSSKQNSLTVSFSDYNYGNEIPHRFHVHFSGGRTNWSESIAGNSISLPDLHPGRYTLSIATTDSPEEKPAVLSIRIRNPWFLSWPMLLVYLLSFAAVVYWIIRYVSIKNRLDVEKREREILLEQSKQKEAFFGNVAHEFKTPLSLIIAPLARLLQETKDPREREVLQVAHENAGKLNTLIHKTIDFYKENNRTTDDLIRTEVEFVEFARAIFLSFKDNYPNHEFIFDSSEPSMVVDVDIVKMEAVLNNLLSNACKYTPEGGSVILTLDRDATNHQLVVKVSDTGIGIPKEELQLVFQRYFESSRSKKGGYESTGIGLSLVQSYIECHGGTVSADSDDNGSSFTVVVPYTSDGVLAENGEQPEDGASDKALVVIVDDNPQICAFLESVLKDKYRCINSNNGKSGLKLCKDVLPDLIIADVMMPVMDGLEMCRQIREYGPLSTIPIILLTAKGDKETEKRSISLGIDSFVPKPFELPSLLARVDQLIGNKQRMEQKLRMELLSAPQEGTPLSYDEKFLKKVTKVIEDHMDDSDLSVTKLCELGDFSEKLLYRKLKQLTGLSTVEYIRTIRLKKAALLLQNGNFTVSEAMYSVGFSNASYFTRAFSAQYGKTPSEYLKQYKKQV